MARPKAKNANSNNGIVLNNIFISTLSYPNIKEKCERNSDQCKKRVTKVLKHHTKGIMY